MPKKLTFMNSLFLKHTMHNTGTEKTKKTKTTTIKYYVIPETRKNPQGICARKDIFALLWLII
jgi:hypothetical protein